MFFTLIPTAFVISARRLLVFMPLLILVLLLTLSPVHAGTFAGSTFSGAITAASPCYNQGGVLVPYDPTPFTVPTSGVYMFEFAPGSPTWTHLVNYLTIFTSSTPAPDPVHPLYMQPGYVINSVDGLGLHLTAGQDYILMVGSATLNTYLVPAACMFQKPDFGTYTIKMTFRPDINYAIPHVQGQLNWQHGESYASIFDHADGVAVYCSANGTLAMHIHSELVANAPDVPQHVPILEYTENGCRVAFYMLDDGKYQINITSPEGKLYEIIADNIDFRNAERRTFDPDE